MVSARKSVMRFDLLSSDAQLTPLPLTDLAMVIAFDFDMANNCLYWADVGINKIMVSCELALLCDPRNLSVAAQEGRRRITLV